MFCTSLSYKSKIRLMYATSLLFFAASSTWLVWSSIQLKKWGPFDQESDTTFDFPRKEQELFGKVNYMMFFPMLLTVSYYYSCMLFTLNRCTHARLRAEKVKITIFFSCLIVALFLRFFYSIFLGKYYAIVC